ncbi:ABC transporter substrate-binding protein [Peribacillus alkalitolerans]|uniref:ABC transporter substrate-binding protein n=1 Tax=Peribacillus alkalitolerans TaxID=1550385 RepID=UPI0013D32985|nr:ABC transporter substrate-binding protein [Peribacillus alkalitolerans]
MKKISSLWMLLVLVASLLLAACGNDTETKKVDEETSKVEEKAEFPVTLTDGIGKEVTLDAKPEKIVSLIPSNTEILFALNLDKEIVGVSDFDNYPEAATKKEKIGGMEFNVEKIISLSPDVVFAHASGAHNSEAGLEQIRQAGIPVFVVEDAQSFDTVYSSIETMGTLTGKKSEAEKLVTDMQAKLADIKEKVANVSDQKSVVVEVSPSPEIYTTGKNTFMNEILTSINVKNAAGDQEGWIQLTEEAYIQMNPQVIITTYGGYVENPVDQVLSRKGWDEVSAIKNKAVYNVDADRVTRPGPRLIEGVEELASAIYPDIFKK